MMPGRYCAKLSAYCSVVVSWFDSRVWTYAKEGQQNVEQKLGAAAALEEDTERREDNGEDNLANVAREDC